MVNAIVGTRWLKLFRDLEAEWGRVLLMVAAIAVSIVAVGAILGAHAVLTRAITANYLDTHPAAATLDLEGDAGAAALVLARQHPAVADAEARDVILARAQVGADWRPLLLFVCDDFVAMRLNTIERLDGAWPPATGDMLIDVTATAMLGTEIGRRLRIKTAQGMAHEVPVTGRVNDHGLVPAWQERIGYGYISRETLASLGEPPVLHELRIALRDPSADAAAVAAVANDVGRQLAAHGIVVHEIRVPPPRQHPHYKQMTTMLYLMLTFSVMALVLSSLLVANSLSAMLARQAREIGVMKTVGARTGQIIRLYATLVAVLGAVAVVVAIPAGLMGARALTNAVAGLLNLNVADNWVPLRVFAVQGCCGVLVPLCVALVPILRASRTSVRATLDQHGIGSEGLRLRTGHFPLAVRNALRRPGRLALTVALLSAGGAMFMTALNVAESWDRNIAKIYETRHYDVEVRFYQPQSVDLARSLRELPGIAVVETWGYSPVAVAKQGQIDVVRAYPDRGHASVVIMAPPTAMRLVSFPVLAGRWLRDDDTDAVVLNHAMAAQMPEIRVGDTIDLSIAGRRAAWRVVGLVEEIGSVGAAYVAADTFERIAGTGGQVRMLRIATLADSPQARVDAIRAIERRLDEDRVSVETVLPLTELSMAMTDHIMILIRLLIAMAVILAAVGTLGLTSALGIDVLERMREFAVMKTIGATPRRIVVLVLAESLFIGMLSWLAAFVFALPLTLLLDTLVGNLGFVAALPFVISPGPALMWLVLIAAGSILASGIPARRASQLSVAQALVQL